MSNVSTTDSTPIVHPEWCFTAHCTATRDQDHPSYLWGNHQRYTHGFTTIWGSKIELYLMTEAQGEARMRIALLIPAHEDVVPMELRDTREGRDWRRDNGERIELEPEEARMLARFLVGAADEWERATRRVVRDDRGQVADLDGYEPLNP